MVGVERFTAPDYKPGLIRHIVLFRYNREVSSEQKQEVINRFLALKTLAKRNGSTYILSIETGSDISGEGLDQCFEQGFIVTFKSQGDRNYYVGQPVVTDPSFYDPAHQAFKDFVAPLLDQNGAFVFDFSVGE
ncbi:MAG: Dabb family protein [Candidatus Binataceae bacterium]